MMNITWDLETLGNTSQAPIVQIGAVKFTDDGDIVDKFVRNIKIESLSRYNFYSDYKTIRWWFSQDDDAIKSVFCNTKEEIPLKQALNEFKSWIGKPKDYIYWSHATFDPPILDNNYKQTGMDNPIPFRLHRDIRTLSHLSKYVSVERKGIHHDALDDCIFQAEYISKQLKTIKNN